MSISFKPVTSNDLNLLKRWMTQPHWEEWWGNVDGELDDIRNMVEGRDTTRPFIFLENGKPMGYIQYWFLGHHQNKSWLQGYPWLAKFSEDTIGVDISIGESKNLSKHIGTRAVKTFIQNLLNLGHNNIIIDPDPTNIRAIKCYTNAGFEVIDEFKDVYPDILLMRYQNS